MPNGSTSLDGFTSTLFVYHRIRYPSRPLVATIDTNHFRYDARCVRLLTNASTSFESYRTLRLILIGVGPYPAFSHRSNVRMLTHIRAANVARGSMRLASFPVIAAPFGNEKTA
jgi:hypothetical protein